MQPLWLDYVTIYSERAWVFPIFKFALRKMLKQVEDNDDNWA